MWRPAHGATSRPGPCRPASGYGRALGRPGPEMTATVTDEPSPDALDPATFVERVGVVEVEIEAPVTP
jgi:hypothetical protein